MTKSITAALKKELRATESKIEVSQAYAAKVRLAIGTLNGSGTRQTNRKMKLSTIVKMRKAAKARWSKTKTK